MANYYVDTCIYLNLWKKEVGKNGEPYWRYAQDFLEKHINENDMIFFSGCILRELENKFDYKMFKIKIELFNRHKCFNYIKLSPVDKILATKIEKQLNYCIGYFDILHILLAKKTDSILITRDGGLIAVADRHKIKVKRPEEV